MGGLEVWVPFFGGKLPQRALPGPQGFPSAAHGRVRLDNLLQDQQGGPKTQPRGRLGGARPWRGTLQTQGGDFSRDRAAQCWGQSGARDEVPGPALSRTAGGASSTPPSRSDPSFSLTGQANNEPSPSHVGTLSRGPLGPGPRTHRGAVCTGLRGGGGPERSGASHSLGWQTERLRPKGGVSFQSCRTTGTVGSEPVRCAGRPRGAQGGRVRGRGLSLRLVVTWLPASACASIRLCV